MSRVLIRLTLLILVGLCLTGCSLTGGSERAVTGADKVPPAAANRFARAIGYMDAGQDDRARHEFEVLGREYPELASAHINLGIIHGREGRPDAAEAALRRAVTVCHECASAYNHLGIVQRQQGQFEAAEQSYLRAIEADPDYALAYYNLGVLYDLYRGRPELALQYYEDYVARETREDAITDVNKWIIDLKRRVKAAQQSALNGGAS